jgi:nucleoside-diphosphate-sugar epimerase
VNVLVTGANGFIGAHLCRVLAKKSFDVYALVRESSDLTLLNSLIPGLDGINLVYGDLTNIDSLKTILTNKNIIFNMAGRNVGLTQSEYDDVNVLGSRNICETLLNVNPKVSRVIMISSLAGAGPSSQGKTNTEDMPPMYIQGDRYGFSKWKLEKVVKEYMDKLPIVIIRPPMVFGPGDTATLSFFKLSKLGIKISVGWKKRYYSIVNVNDLCEGIYQCAINPKAVSEILYFTSGEPVDIGALQEIIMDKVFGRKRNPLLTFKVPPGLFALAGCLIEIICKLTKTALFFNRSKVIESIATGWTCSREKAQKILGWKPKYTVETTVEQAGKWYIKQKMI